MPFSKKFHDFAIGKHTLKQRIIEALLSAMAVSFILLLFGPLDLATKAEDFVPFTATDILPECLKWWSMAFTILFLFAWLPGGRIHTWLVSFFTGLALAFFIQAHWLNPDLGILDGTAIDWTQYSTVSLVNLFIFVLILLIPLIIHFFSRKVWLRFTILVCATLILMQAIPLGTKLFKEYSNRPESRYVIQKYNEYRIGSEENLIVFILDASCNRDITNALSEYPDMLEPFNDFISFDNMSSYHWGTFPSTTYLLTNSLYDFKNETPEAYFSRAWHSDDAESFYAQLHENGWSVNVFNEAEYSIGNAANAYGKLSNIEKTEQPEHFTIDRSVFKKLIFLSLYRYFPLIMKAPYWIYTGELAGMKEMGENEKAWKPYESLERFWESGVTIGDEKKVFLTYHYNGAHRPQKVNRWERVVENSSRNEQIAGHFYLISEYMRALKDLKVYDNATIIITADHGKADEPSSIFYIKPIGRRSAQIKTSHAPITTGEYMETLAQAAGLPKGQFGRSVFEVPEDEKVLRCTYVRGYDETFPPAEEGKHDNVIYEYCTTGDLTAMKKMIDKQERKEYYFPHSMF